MQNHTIARSEREADFKALDKLILTLEHNADTNLLTIPMLKRYQESLNEMIAKYSHDPSFRENDGGLYKPGELHALIFLAQGNEHMADMLLRDAKQLMRPGEHWVSESAKKWDAMNSTADEEATVERKFNGEIEGWLALYSLNFLVVPAFLFYDLFVNAPKLREAIRSLTDSSAGFQSYFNFAVGFDVLAIIFIAVLGYFFFTKSRITKNLAIGFSVFMVVGGFIAYSMLSDIATKNGVTLDDSSGSFVTAGSFVWPFYWVFSRRVKETFIYD